MNKVTLKENTILHCFTYILYLADPATSLATDGVLGPFFPLKTAFFIQLWKKMYYDLNNIVNQKIQSLNFWPFEDPNKHFKNRGPRFCIAVSVN